MKHTFLSAIAVGALMLCGAAGYAGAKAKTPAADIDAGAKAQADTKAAKTELAQTAKPPHATGQERAVEVGQGKKKGLEKQGYTVGGGEAVPGKLEKASDEKASDDEGEKTEPAVVITNTDSGKETKPQAEPKAEPKPKSEQAKEPAEQPQKNQGGGFGR